MVAEIIKESAHSSYAPGKDVVELTKEIRAAYSRGNEILTRSWVELNNYSVIDRDGKDKRTFNSLVDENVEDPNEAWKWRGTRSLARNKAMAMHAQLTSGIVVPTIVAQNESQEQDQELSEAMRDVLEWMTVNSNYRQKFLLIAMAELVSPVAYLEADYVEVFQTIKERGEDGKITTKEILDEVLSGFQNNILSCNQVLITNAYEQDIQRQYRVLKANWIEYGEAKSRYGNHPNWPHVAPGRKTVLSEDGQTFYDVFDDEHPDLVEEVTALCRTEDSEVCFLGGIYMGEANIEDNPIRHRDNRNAPKYNIVPFGYERITEHFFFFKSLINRVGWDDQLLDAMYQVHMNRAFLEAEAPVAISGDDKIDSGVMFPGAQIANADPNFKVTSILPPRGGNAYADMKMIEDSMSEASISKETAGQLPEASQKAYTVAQSAANARIILKGVANSLTESIRQYGELMIDIALQHVTTPEMDELTGNLKYRSFILENQIIKGKKISKELRFDEALMGSDMSEKERKGYRMRLLNESGYPDNKRAIYVINPSLWSKRRYMARVETDMLMPTNKEYMQGIMIKMYTLLRNDPTIDPESLVRRTLHSFFSNDADELMKKNQNDPFAMLGGAAPMMNGAAAAPPQGAAPKVAIPNLK